MEKEPISSYPNITERLGESFCVTGTIIILWDKMDISIKRRDYKDPKSPIQLSLTRGNTNRYEEFLITGSEVIHNSLDREMALNDCATPQLEPKVAMQLLQMIEDAMSTFNETDRGSVEEVQAIFAGSSLQAAINIGVRQSIEGKK